MPNETIPVHSEQRCGEVFSEPTHVPLVIGSETIVLTFQDQRIIIDRRNWFLSRLDSTNHPQMNQPPHIIDAPPSPPQAPASIDLPAFILRLIQEFRASEKVTEAHQPPYCFHYTKQTDTDDLPYYQNWDRLTRKVPVVKHVHFYVESSTKKSKASNTEDPNVSVSYDLTTDDDEEMKDLWSQTTD